MGKKESNDDFLRQTIFQNLTRRNFFTSKSNPMYFLQAKILRFVFFSIEKMAGNDVYKFKTLLVETARGMQMMSFWRSTMNQNLFLLKANIFLKTDMTNNF